MVIAQDCHVVLLGSNPSDGKCIIHLGLDPRFWKWWGSGGNLAPPFLFAALFFHVTGKTVYFLNIHGNVD